MKYPFIPLEFEFLLDKTINERSYKFLEIMKKRRTVRDYSSRPIPRSTIENAIKAAGSAPSGANMQPWHFVVVTNPEIRTEIRQAAELEEKKFYSHRASQEWLDALAPLGTNDEKLFLESASCVICIFLKKFSGEKNGKKVKNYYTSESVGIATGILITALHYSGIATLTHTPNPMRFLNKILGRPNDEKPYLLLVAGFPTANTLIPDIKRHNLDTISTFLD
tara:strand:- start:775 stop:1440 length:666 start_codon:yes stop_codon:yes gene_type:complete